MIPSLQFRRAVGMDAEELSRIAFLAKQHWGYPGEWMEVWRGELTLTVEYVQRRPVFVAMDERNPVGFFGLEVQRDEAWLEHFWLRPEYLGRGLGRVMFAETIRQVRNSGYASFRIKADPHAEPFYLKMGAVRIGTEVGVLPDNTPRILPLLLWTVA